MAQLTEPRVDRPPRQHWRAPTPDAGIMLADLIDHPMLTSWEFHFLESIHSQHYRRRRLSDRQLDILTRIWSKLEDYAA